MKRAPALARDNYVRQKQNTHPSKVTKGGAPTALGGLMHCCVANTPCETYLHAAPLCYSRVPYSRSYRGFRATAPAPPRLASRRGVSAERPLRNGSTSQTARVGSTASLPLTYAFIRCTKVR